jgi:hypothetical protein
MTIESQIAFAAGYNAAVNGKVRAPAMCGVYRSMIEGEPVGGRGVEFANAWLAGYELNVDEECAKVLAS